MTHLHLGEFLIWSPHIQSFTKKHGNCEACDGWCNNKISMGVLESCLGVETSSIATYLGVQGSMLLVITSSILFLLLFVFSFLGQDMGGATWNTTIFYASFDLGIFKCFDMFLVFYYYWIIWFSKDFCRIDIVFYGRLAYYCGINFSLLVMRNTLNLSL